jgi:hypothetical protein
MTIPDSRLAAECKSTVCLQTLLAHSMERTKELRKAKDAAWVALVRSNMDDTSPAVLNWSAASNAFGEAVEWQYALSREFEERYPDPVDGLNTEEITTNVNSNQKRLRVRMLARPNRPYVDLMWVDTSDISLALYYQNQAGEVQAGNVVHFHASELEALRMGIETVLENLRRK